MKEINKVKVSYNGKVVGSIIRYQRYLTAFAYDPEWLSNGFSISPFSLPLREEPFIAKQEPFDGLFGVFADSLPDGWGRLLLDRLLLKNKINPHSVGNLERLAIVGASGMGALSYEPEYNISEKSGFADLDKLAEECSLILSSEYNDNIDELFSLGGSSGGARPKILTEVDGEDWIIKFPAHVDGKNAGLMEYRYSQCAKQCGIDMEETQYSKLVSDIPAVDVVITMGCNVNCPWLPCNHREDWGLEDPTGKDDETFRKVIQQIEDKMIELIQQIKEHPEWRMSD